MALFLIIGFLFAFGLVFLRLRADSKRQQQYYTEIKDAVKQGIIEAHNTLNKQNKND